jgi:hypothetical protein
MFFLAAGLTQPAAQVRCVTRESKMDFAGTADNETILVVLSPPLLRNQWSIQL